VSPLEHIDPGIKNAIESRFLQDVGNPHELKPCHKRTTFAEKKNTGVVPVTSVFKIVQGFA
jgi:hypothetical protein